MNKKILTAQEWLEDNKCRKTEGKNIWINRMNAYSNYKNEMLEVSVLKYRQFLNFERKEYSKNMYFAHNEISHAIADLLEEYDKHFNLVNSSEGKI